MTLTDHVGKSRAECLLSTYNEQTTSFFLASPKGTLLTEGCHSFLPWEGHLPLHKQVATALRSARPFVGQRPIIVGAIPFDLKKTSPHLFIPETTMWTGRGNVPESVEAVDSPFCNDIRPEPDADDYLRSVNRSLQKIEDEVVNKVVLSRSLHLTMKETVDVKMMINRLVLENKHGYTFASDLPKRNQKKRTLVGASPELLLSRLRNNVKANPLAGSRPRGKNFDEDQAQAKELLHSSKDLHEHAVVVKAVEEALRPYCRYLTVPESPALLHTATMWHLSTEVEGELLDEATSSIELAQALHPTPAVCGTPVEEARETIQDLESFQRDYFTGMVGWCDENGDGEWVVTIRCAEAEDKKLRLFAGAGIVKGSDPEEELAETTAKFQTMLRALGIRYMETGK
ncbi:isochorismate synthase DhbC [Salicibibacter cibi]|uniref:isochorismate synthase n=1 Tax=Salicibibacter cibi TaxID=2743001 RepID=A0A7T6ZES1_9BACI|nr:isochorismate synthase DhbC [Salicibibacter cibi]QQK82042.1 isochorismate synthase DhbC [Salicibibacter cibi]